MCFESISVLPYENPDECVKVELVGVLVDAKSMRVKKNELQY